MEVAGPADEVDFDDLPEPTRQRSQSADDDLGGDFDFETPVTPAPPRPTSAPTVRKTGDAIRVVCRFRPDNDQELTSGGNSCIFIAPDQKSLEIDVDQRHQFNFSHVYPPHTSQEAIFEDVGIPTVDDFLGGYNGAVIAYGQTGSGKTFTMLGPDTTPERAGNPIIRELRGLIPRILEDIFVRIESAPKHIHITMAASFIEVYMEKLQDLIVPEKENLRIQQSSNGLWVTDATQVPVSNVFQALNVLSKGSVNRVTGETKSNVYSSRSHAIFFLTLQQKDTLKNMEKVSQLYLVDLAGSEKVSKTKAEGLRLAEAGNINKALLALGNVINALASRKGHIPYRDSKLTRLLQNSFGGNARTTLVINCSPNSFNAQETLSTLRFGDRSKHIQNVATVNQHRSVEELMNLLRAANRDLQKANQYSMVLADENFRLREAYQRETGKFWRASGLPSIMDGFAGTPPSQRPVTAAPATVVRDGPDRPDPSADWNRRYTAAPSTPMVDRSATHRNTVLQDKYNRKVTDVHLFCPLTKKIMQNPVFAMDGHTYERAAIEHWFRTHRTTPLAMSIPTKQLVPNWNLKSQIRMIIPNRDLDVMLCYFNALPAEIVETVFWYLDFRSLVRCSQVCKFWNQVLQEERSLWTNRFSKDFFHAPDDKLHPAEAYRRQFKVTKPMAQKTGGSAIGLKLVRPTASAAPAPSPQPAAK